jgi:hypothetical protein
VTGEQFQTIFVGHIGLGLALGRFHILQVGGHRFSQRAGRAVAAFLNRFDSGTVGFQFKGLAASAVKNLGAILDLLALSAVLLTFDVVVSLGMRLDFTAHADLVTRFTATFDYGRVEVPVFADF